MRRDNDGMDRWGENTGLRLHQKFLFGRSVITNKERKEEKKKKKKKKKNIYIYIYISSVAHFLIRMNHDSHQ